MKEKRILLKTLVYRIFTLTGSMLVGLIIIGNLFFSLGYTILWEVGLNTIIYYTYERLWNWREKKQTFNQTNQNT